MSQIGIGEVDLESDFAKRIADSPFKIGDVVRVVSLETDAKWIVKDFILEGDKFLVVVVCNDIHTVVLEKNIQFYYC